MTELNDVLEPAGEPPVAWPEDPAATGDEPVDAALLRLRGISLVPVTGHSEVYAELHDSLLTALNAEPDSPAHPMASGQDIPESGGA
jgi:hypothetical protein